jgi:hypothetical protein
LKRSTVVVVAAALASIFAAAAACGTDNGAAPSPSTTPGTPTATPTPVTTPTPGTTPTPSPTPAAPLTAPQVKYLLIDHYDGIFYCDPHEYPIGRPEEEKQQAAIEFPNIQADTDEYEAILDFLGVTGTPEITDAFRLQVFREHKKLNALMLTPYGDHFEYTMRIGAEGDPAGATVEGTVSRGGQVNETERTQSFNTCPICLSDSALIATPYGPVPVTVVQAGMTVWTMGLSGSRVAAEVVSVGSVSVPLDHEMVRTVLSDGRVITASPGHPLADGRILAEVKQGDVVDGSRVISVDRVRYNGQRTYDILPAGETGIYWADGVPLGSTLRAS